MPIDYKNYPKNWKTEIRPAILTRAFDHCEFCNVKNSIWILRGFYYGREVYQDTDGTIYDASNSMPLGADYVGTVGNFADVKIVLTIAHIDHDTANNDFTNLRALCQRCHNRYDKEYRNQNRRLNRELKQPKLF